MTSGTTSLHIAADTAAGVLEHARDRRRAADAAEADLLQDAVTWADLHPAESIHDAALLSRHGDQPLAVAGPGAPLVAEFCVAEFAAAVGLPTETGKAYLGEALELRHRLPRTWTRVVSGDLPAWRARRIALCRRHHRLKTHHSGWGYTVLEPGSYLWSSPHGYQFLRDHTGTTDVTHDRATHPPDR